MEKDENEKAIGLNEFFRGVLKSKDGKSCENWFLALSFEGDEPSEISIASNASIAALITLAAQVLSDLSNHDKENLSFVADEYRKLTGMELVSDLRKSIEEAAND